MQNHLNVSTTLSNLLYYIIPNIFWLHNVIRLTSWLIAMQTWNVFLYACMSEHLLKNVYTRKTYLDTIRFISWNASCCMELRLKLTIYKITVTLCVTICSACPCSNLLVKNITYPPFFVRGSIFTMASTFLFLWQIQLNIIQKLGYYFSFFLGKPLLLFSPISLTVSYYSRSQTDYIM